jgi:hypothetical protein
MLSAKTAMMILLGRGKKRSSTIQGLIQQTPCLGANRRSHTAKTAANRVKRSRTERDSAGKWANVGKPTQAIMPLEIKSTSETPPTFD